MSGHQGVFLSLGFVLGPLIKVSACRQTDHCAAGRRGCLSGGRLKRSPNRTALRRQLPATVCPQATLPWARPQCQGGSGEEGGTEQDPRSPAASPRCLGTVPPWARCPPARPTQFAGGKQRPSGEGTGPRSQSAGQVPVPPLLGCPWLWGWAGSSREVLAPQPCRTSRSGSWPGMVEVTSNEGLVSGRSWQGRQQVRGRGQAPAQTCEGTGVPASLETSSAGLRSVRRARAQLVPGHGPSRPSWARWTQGLLSRQKGSKGAITKAQRVWEACPVPV